jgi:hypothetical protein
LIGLGHTLSSFKAINPPTFSAKEASPNKISDLTSKLSLTQATKLTKIMGLFNDSQID